jgi:PAS domain S-box-containing protein
VLSHEIKTRSRRERAAKKTRARFQRATEQTSATAELAWHDLKLQILDRVSHILASTVDAEAALREAVTLFQQVFAHRGCAICLADPEQENLTLVAASGSLTHVSERELKNAAQTEPRTMAQYATPLWRGEEIIGLLRIEGASVGEFREHELEAIEIFARQASVALREVIVVREAKVALEKFLDLHAHTHDGYCSFTPDGAIVEINDTQLTWLGYPRETVVGRWRASELLIASGAAAFPDFMARLASAGKAMLETEQICRDGRTIPVRIHARAVFDEGGQFIEAHATIRDLSAEKLLLNRLTSNRKNDSLGHLFGVIAHEFNNLLTGVIGFNALARRQVGAEHRASRSLLEIERAAKGAVALISQLLAFGRSRNSRPAPVDLNQIVRDTARFLEAALPETISLRCLPGECAGTINADQELIQQLILSLCASPYRATDEPGELLIETGHAILDDKFALRHVGARPGSYHFISVTDTGRRVDEEKLRLLREQFFNPEACADSHSLRLAMAQEAVRNYDGYITAESLPGQGVVFTIYLPATATLARTTSTVAAVPRGGSETILVVDDEPMVARFVEQMLSGYGYRILAAESGQAALSLYQQRQAAIDLIVTDVVMPEMQGPELCRAIRQINPAAKVLLTSGYSTSDELRKLIAEGTPFIQKPYQGDDLAARVRGILDES